MKSTRPLKVRPGKVSTVSAAGSPTLDSSKIALKDLRLNPNRRKIGNRVEAHVGLDSNAGKSIAFGDVAGNWRIDFQFLLHLPGGFKSGDFLLRDAPLLESFHGCIEQ